MEWRLPVLPREISRTYENSVRKQDQNKFIVRSRQKHSSTNTSLPRIKRYSRKSYDHPVILCKSRRSTETTMGSILSFIEKMLFLKVNRDKAKVVYIKDIKFLDCSFYRYKGEGSWGFTPRVGRRWKPESRSRHPEAKDEGMGAGRKNSGNMSKVGCSTSNWQICENF